MEQTVFEQTNGSLSFNIEKAKEFYQKFTGKTLDFKNINNPNCDLIFVKKEHAAAAKQIEFFYNKLVEAVEEKNSYIPKIDKVYLKLSTEIAGLLPSPGPYRERNRGFH